MSTPEIPVELWSEIFAFSREYDPGSVQNLARANHSFRNIVNATPELWQTSFVITGRELAEMQRVQFLMRKSGGLPLQILINLPKSHSAEEMKEVGEMLNEMMPRFQIVTLVAHSYRLTRILLDAMTKDQPAPLLEQLQIHNTVITTDNQNAIGLCDLFHPSPRLIDVKLPPEVIPYPTAPPSPLFFTITKLSIIETNYPPPLSIEQLVKLLSNMPVLEEFSFRGGTYDSPFPPPDLGPPATPRLRSVEVVTPGIGMYILYLLRAPCLSEVHIRTALDFPDTEERRPRAEILRNCLRHLSRTASSITKLTLHDTEFLEPHFEYPQIFQGELFSSLECVVLCATDITNEILGLCRPSGTLKRLELRDCSQVTYDGALPFRERCRKDFEFESLQVQWTSTPGRYMRMNSTPLSM